MMKSFWKFCLPAIAALGLTTTAAAEESPAITFHTNIYANSGEGATFTLLLGATEAGVGQTITINDGFGSFEATLSQANVDTSGTATGCYIQCIGSEEGIVNIYCDPSWIDWINFDGCYIDSIDLGDATNLFYLSLSNNELKSLDLTKYTNISALYLDNNPFDESPLVIGPKQDLSILEINGVGALSPDFTLTDYPTLNSFVAWNASGLTSVDASNCPNLVQISVDGTDVSYLDVSQNPKLSILNVSDTRVTSLDLSNNPALTQLYCTHESDVNMEYKIKSLDLSQNPELIYLFCTGNDLTELDVTNNPKLGSITARKNKLTHINVDNNPKLYCLNISGNYFDFVTLPEPQSTWTEYDYKQSEMEVNKSYAVGTDLDFSAKVLRDGTTTSGALYAINEETPLDPLPIDTECYNFLNGVITLNKVPTYNGAAVDSVYCEFTNTMFSEYPLQTTKFKVKSADEFGKPVRKLRFTCAAGVGDPVAFSVGIGGATATEPRKFYVDLGDGEQKAFYATSAEASTINVNDKRAGYAYIDVYVEEGDYVSAISIADMQLYSIDLSELRAMQSLSLVNTGLYTIDMQWNRSLKDLTLKGNNFYQVSLASDILGYSKNALVDVDLSNNGMTTFTWNENFTVQNLNLSGNKLSELSLSKNTEILTLDISNNEFEYLNAQECSALTSLNVSNNKLTQLLLPTESVLTSLKENNNKFTLATLPQIDGLTEFVYAPQTEYTIPTKGPGVNLSSQYLKGTTTYVWKKVDGTLLVAGTDYTEKEGKFSFTRDDIGKVYCEMTNSELPDFSGENVYKTTVMETAGMPQHVVATFVTANSDEDAVLTMTSLTEGNAVFVDWTGNFDLEQYDLGTTYTAYDVTTTAGAEVTVYSYDEVDNISVFTLRNATLKSMDASAMKQLVCFGVTNGGLSDADIKYPESPNLGELLMQGNKISAFDFTKYKNLWYVNLAENAYKEFTLPDNMPIQQLFIGGNEMTKMDLGKNSTLWSLFAEENNLESVDFTGVPNISQMTLANNKLSTIDLSPIKNLNALSLVGNRFTFVTLPRLSEINPNNASPVYYYGNQENLNVTPTEDGVIDLSEQAYVGETATTYTWILGTPNYDDDGELTNEVLISVAEATADDTESDETDDDSSESTDEAEEVIPDYEEVGGVSTFFFTFDNLVCMMNNAEFENLTLMTNPVKVSGVETVGTDVLDSAYVKVEGHNVVVVAPAGLNIRIYDTAGRSVAGRTAVEGENLFSGLGSGIYVVTLGNKAAKVLVK